MSFILAASKIGTFPLETTDMATCPEQMMGYSLPEEVLLCFYGIGGRKDSKRLQKTAEPFPDRWDTRRPCKLQNKSAGK